MPSQNTKMIKLHTKDGDVVYSDNSIITSVPVFKDILEDVEENEVIDIILLEYTSIAVSHIINIVKYGSTAVVTEDVKDVIEAAKLFLNVDLSSGIITKSEDGYEFEINQGFKCRKYVCGTNVNKEILYIYKEVEKREEIVENTFQSEVNDSELTPNEIESTETVQIAEEMRTKIEEEDDTDNPIDDRDRDVAKKKVYLDKPSYNHKRADEYLRLKQKRIKKKELHDIIINSNERVRLNQHYKLYWNSKIEKQKYPGLIIDNEITEWSVCLKCCLPTTYFKNHKCGKFMDHLKNKEIEKVQDFSKNERNSKRGLSLFAANSIQLDVDKVKCRHCDAIFLTAEPLKKHLKSDHNVSTEQQFVCKYCGKMLENEKSIKAHELRNHGNIEYGCQTCDYCGKSFLESNQLKRHVSITHVEARPFVCDICPKTFKQRETLVAHRLIHSGEKNFSCQKEGCDKAFTKEWTLVQHERIHTGVKPYSCKLCDVSFAQKNSLNVHNNTHHKA